MKTKQKYTIFPDGDISRYYDGDEAIDGALTVEGFPEAKDMAKGRLLLKLETIDKLKMRDVK